MALSAACLLFASQRAFCSAEPVIIQLTSTETYTVPTNKVLILEHVISGEVQVSGGKLVIAGFRFAYTASTRMSFTPTFKLPAGTVIGPNGYLTVAFFGLLLDPQDITKATELLR
jgi:hypothetical protein